MDIDLLSKIVKELILDNDEVALLGIGSFVAEIVPSSFSDKGYTINPPYRRLAFRQKTNGNENLLIDFYAKCNGLDNATAARIIGEFMEEMRHVLETKKAIIFPGLGKLRATRENHFFFVADEDLDIYPEGFGLEPISLKTHEETPAEVSATMAALRSILNPDEDADTEVSEPTVPETPDRQEPEHADTRSGTDEAVPAEEVNSRATEENVETGTPESTDTTEATNTPETTETSEISETPDSTEIPDTPETTEAPDTSNTSDKIDAPETSDTTDAAASQEHGTAEDTDVKPGNGAENTENPAADTADSDPTEDTGADGEKDGDTPEKGDGSAPEDNATGTTDNEPDVQPEVQKATADNVIVAATAAAETSGTRRNTWRIVKWTVLTLIFLAVMVLVVFIILAHIAPDFIDSILYTPEELELLNL